MSTETLDRLRLQISQLSRSERAELARELITSLDGVRDETAEQAWDKEVMRRIAEVETGKAELLTRDELRHEIRSRMGS